MHRLKIGHKLPASILAITLALLGPSASTAQTDALRGFGAQTRGGADGSVVRVTSLGDAGPGTLRDALSQGHRTVVFDVAGEIPLAAPLYVLGSHITLDGSSAPAPGISLEGHGLILRGDRGAHDVIIRGIRIRNAAIDGIQVSRGAFDVVIDRVSVTGSADGNIDITDGSHDVTVSWSILGANAKNMLVKYHASRVTLHHNAFVASTTRNPQVRIDDDVATAEASELTADIRNNLIAGWGIGYGTLVWRGPRANVVNNYYAADNDALSLIDARAYMAGNLAQGVDRGERGTEARPFSAPAVETQEACQAAALVLAGAGARPLDATDRRLLSTIETPACETRAPRLDAGLSSVILHAATGGADPPIQFMMVAESGGGAVDWSATASTPWLVISPPQGTTPSSLGVTARTADLKPGTYSDTIVLTGAPGSTATIAVLLIVAAVPADSSMLRLVIEDRRDDARETRDGVVRVNEKSLPVGAGNRVALRFTEVRIPRGAVIGSAVLTLTAINQNTLQQPLRIRYQGEAADDSAPFTQSRDSLGTRAKTIASIDDSPDAWVLGAPSASPDLAGIIQEIVARPAWTPGNALTVFIEDTGSPGARLAGSRDEKADRAATLTITYWNP